MALDSVLDRDLDGLRTLRELQQSECAGLPQAPGIYVVTAPAELRTSFIEASPAGRYEGRDPTVGLDMLKDAWVDTQHFPEEMGVSCYYSAIMDEDTCQACAALDGAEHRQHDPMYATPNPKCTSIGCRCATIYVFRESVEECLPILGVLYVGQSVELRRRVREFLWFGAGQPVGHWGGRYLWQISGIWELALGWYEHASPEAEEERLLSRFRSIYGRVPFGNLV